MSPFSFGDVTLDFPQALLKLFDESDEFILTKIHRITMGTHCNYTNRGSINPGIKTTCREKLFVGWHGRCLTPKLTGPKVAARWAEKIA